MRTEGITLAASSTLGRLQAEHLSVQVTAWDSSAVVHLSDECQLVPDASHRLWSSGKFTCVAPLTKTQLGDRSSDLRL